MRRWLSRAPAATIRGFPTLWAKWRTIWLSPEWHIATWSSRSKPARRGQRPRTASGWVEPCLAAQRSALSKRRWRPRGVARSIGRQTSSDCSETSKALVSIVPKSVLSCGLAGDSRLDSMLTSRPPLHMSRGLAVNRFVGICTIETTVAPREIHAFVVKYHHRRGLDRLNSCKSSYFEHGTKPTSCALQLF